MKEFLSVILVFAMLFVFASCDNSSSVDEIEPTNVALNKRVYFSSEVQAGFMKASQVNDGDEGTSWSSNTSTQIIDEWIMIDLGKNYDVDSITIKWGMSRANDYSVEISRGGVEYTEIHSATNVLSTDPETITADKTARYVRVNCKKVPSVLMDYIGATIKEIEVIGTPSKDQTLGTETEQMTVTKTVEMTADDVLRGGRSYDFKDLVWAGSTYEFQCTGTAAGAVITGESGKIEASVDGGEYKVFEVEKGTYEYLFAEGLEEGTHTVRIIRKDDPWTPVITVDSVVVEETADVVKGYKGNYDLKIEFIGDSITSASGVDYNECYTTIAADILNAHFQVVSRSGMGLYKNAGNGGISEALPQQYQWTEFKDKKKDKPYTYQADVVVLNIGTNDGFNVANYITDSAEKDAYAAEFEKLYYEMLDEILVANPNASILCVYGQLGVNSKIYFAITKTVSKYRAEHPEVTIDMLRFESAKDRAENDEGHPGPLSHARDGKVLAEKIREMLDR